MISFLSLDEHSPDEIIKSITDRIPGSDFGYISEIVESFADMMSENPDTGVGITEKYGCILVRIFDMGRYTFIYPIPISDECNMALACDAIRAYAVREELPLVFTDIPREELGDFIAVWRHAVVDASDPFCDTYRVEIANECMLSENIPTVSDLDLELSPISENDVPDMARLARDMNVNRYWGYDFKEDAPDAGDRYFYETALSERAMGTAITFAVRLDGAYIGEVVLHAFDFLGGAEVALRLLPEYWHRGYGRRALQLSFDAARSIGLVRIYGTVSKKNTVSLNMLSGQMILLEEDDSIARFLKELYR